MKAQRIMIKKNGPAELLKVEDFDLDEKLASDEILIDVKYSGINFADIVMRLGFYRDAPPKPFVPGYELSGIVMSIGNNVTRFKVGDKVVAGSHFGGYTSKIKVKENWAIPLPSNLDLKEAAAIPVNFITAHLAFNEFARVRKGDKVLLDCATGGVGVIALQIIKNAGAKAVGLTSSPSKKEFIESYGAKAYTHEEFAASDEREFDFILNSSAGPSLNMYYDRLKKSGKLCCIGLQDSIEDGKSNWIKFLATVIKTPKLGVIKNIMNSKMVGGFNALKFFEDEVWLEKILAELENTDVKSHIGGVFNAKDVAKAHQALEQRKVRGKVLLEWQ